MGYCVPYELVNTRTLVVCTYVDTRGRIKKKTKKEEEKRCGSNFGKYSNRKYFFFAYSFIEVYCIWGLLPNAT